MVDVYVMLYMHVVLFLCMHERSGRGERVGTKTWYDFVCCNKKEGAGGSRWVWKQGVTLYVVLRKKGSAGAGWYKDRVWDGLYDIE